MREATAVPPDPVIHVPSPRKQFRIERESREKVPEMEVTARFHVPEELEAEQQQPRMRVGEDGTWASATSVVEAEETPTDGRAEEDATGEPHVGAPEGLEVALPTQEFVSSGDPSLTVSATYSSGPEVDLLSIAEGASLGHEAENPHLLSDPDPYSVEGEEDVRDPFGPGPGSNGGLAL